MRFILRTTVLGTALILLAAPRASAQKGAGDWQFAVAPYLWAAGMDGTMAIANFEEDIDVPFGTIIDNLDLALMGHFDMRNDRWVVMSDLIFVDLEDRQERALGNLTAGLELTLLEVAGGYRLSPVIAVLAGARWVDSGTSLRYSGPVVDNDASANTSWIDPLVGVQVLAPLAEKWWLGFSGDIGGFGVGSDLTWQVYANLGFKASNLVSIIVGYRAIDIDYEDDSGAQPVALDMLLSGPQVGVAFVF